MLVRIISLQLWLGPRPIRGCNFRVREAIGRRGSVPASEGSRRRPRLETSNSLPRHVPGPFELKTWSFGSMVELHPLEESSSCTDLHVQTCRCPDYQC